EPAARGGRQPGRCQSAGGPRTRPRSEPIRLAGIAAYTQPHRPNLQGIGEPGAMVKLNALPLVLRIKHVIHCLGSIPHLFNATCDERGTRYMRLDGPGCALPRRVKPYLSGGMRTRSNTAGTGLTKKTPSAPWTLGIHPYVHPGRTRCMRHGLPHARRIGRGMLLLLL